MTWIERGDRFFFAQIDLSWTSRPEPSSLALVFACSTVRFQSRPVSSFSPNTPW